VFVVGLTLDYAPVCVQVAAHEMALELYAAMLRLRYLAPPIISVKLLGVTAKYAATSISTIYSGYHMLCTRVYSHHMLSDYDQNF